MRFSLLLCFLFVGCAGRTLQSEKLNIHSLKLQEQARVEGVSFVSQKKDHCGPATLTMAFNWAGVDITQEQAANEVFTPGAEGSYRMDIVAATRRNGLVSIEVNSMKELLREISQGTPVIVFQNLGFDWYELWHYSIVTGYDLDKKVLFLNSGKEQNKILSFKQFERGWKRGGYWGIVTLPPDKLSATGTEREHIKSAGALEKLGHLDAAKISLMKVIEKWPESHWAWFSIANLQLKQNELDIARESYERALKIEPNFSYGWHNYAILLKKLKEFHSAKLAANKAVSLSSDSNKNSFKESLKNIREMASE